jgi:SAM-dependent methyltransferase
MSSNSNNELDTTYGEAYLGWKAWDTTKFGHLKASERHYYNSEINKSKTTFTKSTHVLEIGFGNGSFLAYAKNRGWDVVGVEANNTLVETARHHGFKTFFADNLTSFEDNSFDLVVAFDVLEHINQGKIVGFLENINRILNNHGVFIARFPNGDSPFGLCYQNGDVTHITTLGRGKVTYLASQLNVDLVFVGGEAQPLIDGNARHTAHRLLALPIKKIVNFLVNIVFFPKHSIDFCSSNLVMIFRTIKSK